MLYCKITEEGVTGPQNLPINYENFSGFDTFTTEQVKEYGWYPYEESPMPAHDQRTQNATSKIVLIDGIAKVVWTVKQKSAEQIEQETEEAWSGVRLLRDEMLAKTDWTHSGDSPLSPEKKAEWAAYRQSLREITKQSDPHQIEWPTRPSK